MEITGAVIYFKQKYGFNHIRLLKVVIFLDFNIFYAVEMGKKSKVNKRAGPNKRAGWNFFQKVNKQAGPNKSEQDGKTSKNK